HEVEDVLLRHPASGAGPRDPGGIEAVLGGDLPDDGGDERLVRGCRSRRRRRGTRGGWGRGRGRRGGRRARRGGSGGGRGGGGGGGGGRLGSRRGRRGVGLQDRHDLIDRDRLTRLVLDLDQRAGGRGGDLGVHLVGRDLEEGLVPLNGLAELLHPSGDRALGD